MKQFLKVHIEVHKITIHGEVEKHRLVGPFLPSKPMGTFTPDCSNKVKRADNDERSEEITQNSTAQVLYDTSLEGSGLENLTASGSLRANQDLCPIQRTSSRLTQK